MNKLIIVLLFLAVCCSQACTPAHTATASTPSKDPIQQFTEETLLRQPGLLPAQVGICLYDPATATYKYNYQGDKYFIPASNTKLFSLYAGMKYLGDSLMGMRYRVTDTALFIIPAGDPTLLHPAYPDQPAIRFLQKAHRNLYLTPGNWQDRPLGRGWAWDDYNDDYMPERSAFPVYGNLIRWMQDTISGSFFSIPDIDWPVRFSPDSSKQGFSVRRDYHNNVFTITEGKSRVLEQDVPFITDGIASAALLLKDTVGKPVGVRQLVPGSGKDGVVYSRPVDSLFRPMMYNSDNFFAEQTLLMVGNQLLEKMNDARVIDTLLNGELKGLPQRPIWVDGCGLSRNDLFTPQDFVWLLDKMSKEFGLARMEGILPTGGKGTLSNYYKADSGYIYAKTGSLSGVVALSGYLLTKKNHLLLFSILINNYTGSGVAVRRQMEQWIHHIRDTY
ncbi:D-alanyl-D-alanine carboxypeptidase/D-alanyl-D-alanine-endopeptidase [Puia dinghuensis]|uniref:D-alanyl-D-alanine carboxypeptidase n=1 Tax=Puia dinghuensis TaxID=1792502 RepID=A0A8J2UFC8_9BACT|nr:D-alanyl-D-alanine carboxypeptidase [Puia dinghuensis]GGB09294.1 D-alanyl-D-alanine carboxypeptidase [Puia dinghuensis]